MNHRQCIALLAASSLALSAIAIAIALARVMPEQAIICDESVTSGRDFFRSTYGAAPHDFLQLTGGAIGLGIPMATGAAVACPDRKVIGLQAVMYAIPLIYGVILAMLVASLRMARPQPCLA